MKKEFSLSKGKAMINFSAKYCDTIEKILESDSFRRVTVTYLESIAKRNTQNYKRLVSIYEGDTISELTDKMVEVLKLLTLFHREEVIKIRCDYEPLLSDPDWFSALLEDFYAFWRRLERYSVIQNRRNTDGLAQTSFIDANHKFTNLILELYRKIGRNVLGYEPNVFRQVPAGVNAGVILQETLWPIPKGYEILSDIPFISAIVMDSPFISYPKKNKRDGIFQETFVNPMDEAYLNRDHFFCYPAKIGKLTAFLYFHRDLMAHGISLSNLFEMAREEEYVGRKPDIVYVFGGRNSNEELGNVFYDDTKNDIMLGFVPYSDEIDYFGYMKKMSLTLHNLIMIKRGHLPIHGAMVNINMKNGKSANVVIMGDSGAGKSESLEALRSLSEDHISDMTIIFDDMGFFTLENGKVMGYGTEIGAFVRLDDLDQGYAFKEIDRSIFMNPDKTNARLVMPVATYKEVVKGYPVDLFLYANNYKVLAEGEPGVRYFKDQNEAKEIFRSGKRMAKGTTTENGLVESYFANPFGPLQKSEDTDKLLDIFFTALFKNKIKVGEIYTQLGVPDKEKSGPRDAAMELFKEITSL
ncbi:phosphoenolpyruvate carboxykinase [Proteiniclasticum sp. SCR006]|uniref:Phosphoenolpyruvate carboxykinase n=1 Tax=Proteiniclasticum aestuarii TaxID=2817862 RepID=A0A939HAG7_9CLOT|nr:phosphoenolpyruvate carboxykinase [Proteiniclasticum aestuarii]MBO1264903.1 phosphoenolpyruvate carboxykinase [Proteiniclasticum aestuarii]